MRLSQRYSDHSAELLGIVNYIMAQDGTPSDAATRLGISDAEVKSITALRTAYLVYIDPNKHNAITVHEMKVADDNAYTVILPLRQRLKTGLADLTPEDYANLEIHMDKTTRTPSVIPKNVPVPILVDSQPLHLLFEATEQTSEGVNRTALPQDSRVAREIAVVAQGTAPSEGDFHSIGTVGHSRFTLTFTSAEVGMDVYIRIAYENTAGRGAFSTPVKAIII